MNLQNISIEEIETLYEQFYHACSDFSEVETIASMQSILSWSKRKDSVLSSYSLLFLGAIIDSKTLPDTSIATINTYLSDTLTTLADFRVSDGGKFIHILSHATFLAESLRQKASKDFSAEILAAYTRNTEMFDFNEDVTVGQYLLNSSHEAFSETLQKIQTVNPANPHDLESRAKHANIKSLWLAMFALNSSQKLQPVSAFDELIENLMQHVID